MARALSLVVAALILAASAASAASVAAAAATTRAAATTAAAAGHRPAGPSPHRKKPKAEAGAEAEAAERDHRPTAGRYRHERRRVRADQSERPPHDVVVPVRTEHPVRRPDAGTTGRRGSAAAPDRRRAGQARADDHLPLPRGRVALPRLSVGNELRAGRHVHDRRLRQPGAGERRRRRPVRARRARSDRLLGVHHGRAVPDPPLDGPGALDSDRAGAGRQAEMGHVERRLAPVGAARRREPRTRVRGRHLRPVT